jgi:signal peptidase II
MNRTRGILWFLVFAAALAALDLGTKSWAFDALGTPDTYDIRPSVYGSQVKVVVQDYFRIALAWNDGAAFSAFRGKLTFFFVVSGLAVLVLLYFAWTAPKEATWKFSLLLGMLGGGVFGNLYDRIRFGMVRDFIDWYVGKGALEAKLVSWFKTAHWPTFNLADSYICIGAVVLFITMLRDDRRAAAESASESAATPAASA